jgi:DNA-binding beta-propeller fold protein YncE
MRFEPIVGWGKLPAGWRYVEVAGVAVDAKDNVFCFTRGEHPVIVFDRDGNFLRSWGEGQIRRAHGISLDAEGMLWLTDDLHHTSRKFTPEGKLLLTIGDPDTPSTLQGGKPFNRPTHVAVCPRTGNLYLSDGYGNSRVHKYTPDGKHLLSWGEPGTDPGQFNIPHNIACDADGWVYVADRENHRVQVFDGNGRYETQWVNMHRPSGLHLDRGGAARFYVGEIGGGVAVNQDMPNIGPRVSIYTAKGELLARLGDRPAGLEPGQFISPHGLAVDSRGDIYVGEVSYTNWGRRGPIPPGLRSLQKLVKQ